MESAGEPTDPTTDALPSEEPVEEPPEVVGVADLVARAVFYRPGRVALAEDSGRRMTWLEVEEQVDRVAAGLAGLGVLGGTRVMLAMGNRLEFVLTYLGVLRAQAVAVPVNPASVADEVDRMLTDSGARVVVADATAVHAVRDAVGRRADGVPLVVTVATPPTAGERTWEQLRDTGESSPVPLPPLRDPEAPAVVLYTSGTSGRPRGAILSHRALLANLDQVNAVRPAMFYADDVVLGVLPLFHVYGLNGVLGAVLRHRSRLVVVDRFDPEAALDLVDQHECSVLPVAPAALQRWLGCDDLAGRLASARVVLSGSAPLDPGVAAAFTERTGIEVHQGYGLTEAAPVVTTTLGRPPKAGSVGRPLPGCRVRLVDEQGQPPVTGDPGQIEIAGPNLFGGYWPDGTDAPGEGWWATGDVGLLDDDGDLFLVDRVRELILVSGFNVYPSEVEDVLSEVDGVTAAAVIGRPDERTGEAVTAYVVGDGADGLRERIGEHVERRLARFKRPVELHLVDALPTTVTGKVQKGRLRAAVRRDDLSLLAD